MIEHEYEGALCGNVLLTDHLESGEETDELVVQPIGEPGETTGLFHGLIVDGFPRCYNHEAAGVTYRDRS